MLIEQPLDAQLEADHAQGADRKDARPVSLRRRGRAGQAGQAGSRRRADRQPVAGLGEPRRRHDRLLLEPEGDQPEVKAAFRKSSSASTPSSKWRSSAATRAANRRDHAGARPHPPEHGAARSQLRPLSPLRREVRRAGRRRSKSCASEIEKLTAEENRLRNSLDDYLMNLTHLGPMSSQEPAVTAFSSAHWKTTRLCRWGPGPIVSLGSLRRVTIGGGNRACLLQRELAMLGSDVPFSRRRGSSGRLMATAAMMTRPLDADERSRTATGHRRPRARLDARRPALSAGRRLPGRRHAAAQLHARGIVG